MNWINKHRSFLEERNYVLKADTSSRYWFGLSKTKINAYLSTFGGDFNIILIGSETNETDYYSIPFSYIQDLLTEASISKSKNRDRWIGDIRYHILHIRNANVERNVANFYSLSLSLGTGKAELSMADINDYAIENAKREIKVRLKQSVFRQRVLKNFDNKCCLTGIAEEDLLIASHIIPWSHQIEHRLNPGNGLCLSVVYDKLFDKGYFTVNAQGQVHLSPRTNQLSAFVQKLLADIDKSVISPPTYYKLMSEALAYHALHVFDKF